MEEHRGAIYRAGDDADVRQGTCFATASWAAKAYLDNGGFGGPILYRCTPPEGKILVIHGGSVQDVYDALEELGIADIANWSGAEFLAQVLDQNPVLEALESLGYDWVQYEDDYPEGCITLRVVSDAAMWSALEGMTEIRRGR